jgi:hypothetical protein
MGLLLQYMKPCIPCNGCKCILNDSMECNPFSTMATTKELDSHGV